MRRIAVVRAALQRVSDRCLLLRRLRTPCTGRGDRHRWPRSGSLADNSPSISTHSNSSLGCLIRYCGSPSPGNRDVTMYTPSASQCLRSAEGYLTILPILNLFVARRYSSSLPPRPCRRGLTINERTLCRLSGPGQRIYFAHFATEQLGGAREGAPPLSQSCSNHYLGARRPTMHPFRDYLETGGLMSYGANNVDCFVMQPNIANRILHGTKPADLLGEQPTRFVGHQPDHRRRRWA
jgi:hypothetical protein